MHFIGKLEFQALWRESSCSEIWLWTRPSEHVNVNSAVLIIVTLF